MTFSLSELAQYLAGCCKASGTVVKPLYDEGSHYNSERHVPGVRVDKIQQKKIQFHDPRKTLTVQNQDKQ